MKESDISREGETGKELVFGFDVDCRPVLYMVRFTLSLYGLNLLRLLTCGRDGAHSILIDKTLKQVQIKSVSSFGVSR